MRAEQLCLDGQGFPFLIALRSPRSPFHASATATFAVTKTTVMVQVNEGDKHRHDYTVTSDAFARLNWPEEFGNRSRMPMPFRSISMPGYRDFRCAARIDFECNVPALRGRQGKLP